MKHRKIIYDAEPTIALFHQSDAFVRGIRGPIGSGKSVGCCWEIYMKAIRQRPDANGRRRSRWAVIRNTYPELKTTTIKTWMEWFADFGKLKMDSPPTFLMEQKLSDGSAVELEVLFLAIELEKDVKKLLSLELTGVWLNEARELPFSVITNAMSRVGRFPGKDSYTWSGVIMDTNSPSDYHWWYRAAEVEHPEGWRFFDQPPAVNKEAGRYVINPAAENLSHQPKGAKYYLDLISGNTPDWIDVMLCNQYKSLFNGKPVYKDAWNEHFHASHDPLIVDPKRELMLGFDFGLTPACVAAQETADGQLRILAEYVSEDMGLTQFLQNLVMPDLRGKFRNLRCRCVGDPAAVQRSQCDSDTSCEGVFPKFGLRFETAPTNDFHQRRQAVMDRLCRFAAAGKPAIILDPSCTMLRQGFNGGYQFRLVQTVGSSGEPKFTETPEKNIFSHIHDALQYLCLDVTPGRSDRMEGKARMAADAASRNRIISEQRRFL